MGDGVKGRTGRVGTGVGLVRPDVGVGVALGDVDAVGDGRADGLAERVGVGDGVTAGAVAGAGGRFRVATAGSGRTRA